MFPPQIIPPPQWVDFGNPSERGLDLLGLRNPVQNIGNIFLDGITTITPAIRYVSFRALAAYSYAQAKLPDDWKLFRDFAEKMEASIAFGNILADVQASGILGTNEAKQRLESNDSDLALTGLVKGIGVNIYSGVSDQLGISFSTYSGIPGLTEERGIPLAKELSKAFEKSELGRQFLEGEAPETATRKSLIEFGRHVRIDEFRAKERSILVDCLMPAEPQKNESYRLATYSLLLSLAQDLNRPPEGSDLFASAIFPDKINKVFADVLNGWLLFLIRDQIAVTHEFAFAEIIAELEARSQEYSSLHPSQEILESILSNQDEFRTVLEELDLIKPKEDFLKLSFIQIHERLEKQIGTRLTSKGGLYRWEKGIHEIDVIDSSISSNAGAILLPAIAWILVSFRLDMSHRETNNVDLLSHQGKTRLGIKEVVIPRVEEYLRENRLFIDVVLELAQLTVDQHLRISWARFAQDPKKLVSVLTSDGDLWAYRREFNPGRTASRLSQSIGWLKQTKLIDENGLTSDGNVILKRSVDALQRGIGI